MRCIPTVQNENVFSDCVKLLYDKSGCLRSVSR